MDPLAAEQPTTPAGDYHACPTRAERCCGLFGCLEAAALDSHQPQRRRAASPLGVTTKPEGRQPTEHTANGAR
jgi:hypothetical protein